MAACSICRHGDRAAITQALTAASLRQVAQQYHVSKSALIRHRQRCGPLQVDQVDHTPTPRGNPLGPYHGEALQLLAALTSGPPWDARPALAAMAQLLVKMTAP